MQKITVGLIESNSRLGHDLVDKLALSDEVELLFEIRNINILIQTLAEGTMPEVLLMDATMPQIDVIDAMWKVKKKYPNLKILMLTIMEDEQKLFEALQAGASGYLLKDVKPHQLLNAIFDVIEGALPLSPSLAGLMLHCLNLNKSSPKLPSTKTDELTKREQEILELLIQGKTVKEIAEKLFIANKSVRKHLGNIYEKVHVNF